MTVFPVLHGKGLELSSQRRFQSRYLRKSVSMLPFNTQGQRVREADCESGIVQREMNARGREMEKKTRWLRSNESEEAKQSIGVRRYSNVGCAEKKTFRYKEQIESVWVWKGA